MLKDLDKRQTNSEGAVNSHIPLRQQSSSHKSLILIVFILVLLNIIGFLGWQLYDVDNSSTNTNNANTVYSELTHKEPQDMVSKTSSSEQDNSESTALINKKVEQEQPIKNVTNALASHDVLKGKLSPQSEGEHLHPHKAPSQATDTHVNNADTISHAVVENNERNNKTVEPKATEPKVIEPIEESSFSISRKNLSSKALIAQKIKRANIAIEKNKIASAEALLEEILLLDANQIESRKKLAALWFGREAFQDAVNLINQGINLTPNDDELRLMKARIYLSQERLSQAYISLKGFTDTENIEYLSLLATLAQQQNEFQMAIKAYERLTKAEPKVGKWWLGLGIALDSNSQFKEAIEAYNKAIGQNDMSRGSTVFVKERMSALGE